MKILDEIDSLSRIGVSDNDQPDILNFMYEFAERVTGFLNIERINVWLLNKEKNALFSIAEYDKRNNLFSHHTYVYEKDAPHYFQHLKEDKIILAPDIHTHAATFEFSDNYAKQYDVISLMDIPLRMNGKLVGVMCFEKTGKVPRVFSELEQTFAIALSQLALAHIENHRRRRIQKKLEETLREKELLIKELNHRVKNNFSVLVSLLRLSKENAQKEKEELVETFEHQVFSMLKVHELLMESETVRVINVSVYLKKLSAEFLQSYPDLSQQMHIHIPESPFEIPVKHSIHLGLIITEIFLNALKYCLLKQHGVFELQMNILSENTAEITVGDTAGFFDFETAASQQNSLGLSLIRELANSSDFDITYPGKNNSQYKIVIKKTGK